MNYKVLLALIVSVLFLASGVLAFEFDNVKVYNQTENKALIKNTFDMVLFKIPLSDAGSATRISPHMVNVIPNGNKELVGWFDAESQTDYENAIKSNPVFVDLNNNNKTVKREYSYRVWQVVGITEEPIMKNVCEEVFVKYLNETENYCHDVPTGDTRTVNVSDWVEVGNKVDLKQGTTRVGLFVKTYEGDLVDWKINYMGLDIQEWSVWNSTLNDRLKAYYTLNNTDAVANYNSVNATANGTSVSGPISQAGKIGNGTFFTSGSNQYINTPLIPATGLTNKSFALWINMTSATNQWIVGASAATVNKSFGLFTSRNTNDNSLWIWGQGAVCDLGTGALTTNKWYYVVVTYQDDGNRTIYVNGTALVSNITSSCAPTTTNLTLGRWSGGNPYDGMIDEFAYWDRWLSPNEVTQLWNAGSGLTWAINSSVGAAAIINGIYINPANNTNYAQGATYNFTMNVSNGNGTSGIQYGIYNFTMFNHTLGNYSAIIKDLNASTNKTIYWSYGTDGSLTTNTTWYTVAVPPNTSVNSSVLLTAPVDGQIFSIPTSISYSGSVTPNNGNVTNATLYVWYSNNTLNLTSTTAITGNTTNTSSWSFTMNDNKSYIYNVLGCATNSSASYCTFATANFTFIINSSLTNVCLNMNVSGASAAISGFPLYIGVRANQSTAINSSTWGNVRFYNSTCGVTGTVPAGTVLPYEIDLKNNTYAGFWVKVNLTTGVNNLSMSISSMNTSANQTPLQVWTDYKDVYHFSESSGNYSYDSAQDNNTLFGYNSATNLSKTLNFSSNTNDTAFGNAVRFNGGYDCAISTTNATADISGANDRSVFAWQKTMGQQGSAVHTHGHAWSFGQANAGEIFALRYDYVQALWQIDYHSGNWFGPTDNQILDFGYNGITSNNINWYFGTDYEGSQGFGHNTAQAPIQVGGAWGINIGFFGCVATFNGTVDEFRVSNKTFTQAYINRTRDNTNASLIVFAPSIAASGNTSSASFSNMVFSPPNNTVYSAGRAFNFSINISGTNGTALGQFGTINYTLRNNTLGNYSFGIKDINVSSTPIIFGAYGTDANWYSTISYYTVASNSTGVVVPNVTLISPANNAITGNTTNSFLCSANTTNGAILTNISLWTNVSGTWSLNQTRNLIGDNFTESAGATPNTVGAQTQRSGVVLAPNLMVNLIAINKDASSGCTRAYLLNSSNSTLVNATFNTNIASFNYTLIQGLNYSAICDNDGSAYTASYNPSAPAYPFTATNVNFVTGYQNGAYSSSDQLNILSVTTQAITNNTLAQFNHTISASSNTAYNWSCQAGDSFGVTGMGTNRTIFLNFAPLISIVYPTATTYSSVTQLNYTVSDNNLQNCWYTLNSGVTNTSITCGNNVSGLAATPGGNTWTVYANDTTGNSNSSTVIFSIGNNWTYCQPTNNVTFLNITFADESTSTAMNGSIDTSTWVYGNPITVNATYTYSNSSLSNPSYSFCYVPPSLTVNVSSAIQYSFTGYPVRTYSTVQSYSNSTTSLLLYLLSSASGTYSSYSVVDAAGGGVLPGAQVLVERQISGTTWSTISIGYTDSSGVATFWLNPNFQYRLTTTLAGYSTSQLTLNPSQSLYTIRLSATNSAAGVYNNSLQGYKWYVSPLSGRLQTGVNYFNFTLASSVSNIYSCKFTLVNITNSVLLNSTTGGNATYCGLTLSYNLTNGQNIFGKFYINNTYTSGDYQLVDADWKWILIDRAANNTAWITNIFANLKTLPAFGNDDNRQEFSRIMFFFFITTIILAAFTFTTGLELQNPGVAILLLWFVVFIASVSGFLTFNSGSDNVPDTIEKYGILIIFSLFAVGWFINAWRRNSQ